MVEHTAWKYLSTALPCLHTALLWKSIACPVHGCSVRGNAWAVSARWHYGSNAIFNKEHEWIVSRARVSNALFSPCTFSFGTAEFFFVFDPHGIECVFYIGDNFQITNRWWFGTTKSLHNKDHHFNIILWVQVFQRREINGDTILFVEIKKNDVRRRVCDMENCQYFKVAGCEHIHAVPQCLSFLPASVSMQLLKAIFLELPFWMLHISLPQKIRYPRLVLTCGTKVALRLSGSTKTFMYLDLWQTPRWRHPLISSTYSTWPSWRVSG